MTCSAFGRWPIARKKKPHPLEATFASWRGAIVTDVDGGSVNVRPAAHIFPTRRGFCWVEPSYADPWGAGSPAMRIREGVFVAARDGFTMSTTDGRDMTVVPFDPRAHAVVGSSITWFEFEWLQSEGRTWLEERERVRERIRRELE